jgi:hypothetical protein
MRDADMNDVFKDHGTKLLGGLTTVIGAIGSIDPAVLQSIFGTNGMAYFTTFAGILTVLRGFQNTKTQGPPQ